MEYKLTTPKMDEIITALSENNVIYAPKALNDGGVRYGEISSASEIVFDQKSDFSPKETIYPVVQTALYFADGACTESSPIDKNIIVFVRSCDIHAFERLDTIFLKNGEQEDNLYARLREKVKFFLIECAGFENCFCVTLSTNKTSNYSVALKNTPEGYLVQVKDSDFKELFASFPATTFAPEFVSENKKAVELPHITSDRISTIHGLEFWHEHTKDCTSCGSCNMVCGTCSCFDTIDIIYSETSRSGERRRIWAGCMQTKFDVMAGGHSVRDNPGDRMRFKVMHKIHDFKTRFGSDVMCVGCGRCEDRCPEEISFIEAIKALKDELKKGGAS